MSITPGRIASVLLAGAVVVGLAALSRAPYRANPGDDAMIRIAWSARPERIETCVEHSDEELAERPAHMRQRVECEGVAASYRLRVLRDSVLLDDEVVTGGGIRHDRPIHLLRDYRVPRGQEVLEVTFVREGRGDNGDDSSGRPRDAAVTGVLPGREDRERDERRRRREEAVPAQLTLRTALDLGPREVVLVTYEAGSRRLVAVRGNRP